MKKLVLIAISSLLSITAHSQFVTYGNVPRPNVSIPKSNFNFEFKRPATPSVSVVNSDIVTTEALCVQTEGESFTIGTKVIVRTLSNGATTLGLIGIKQGQYLQPIITQYFIDNKSEIWLLFLIAHSKR